MTTLITTFITWLSLLTGAPGAGEDIDCSAMAPANAETICAEAELDADTSRPFFFDAVHVTEISNGF